MQFLQVVLGFPWFCCVKILSWDFWCRTLLVSKTQWPFCSGLHTPNLFNDLPYGRHHVSFTCLVALELMTCHLLSGLLWGSASCLNRWSSKCVCSCWRMYCAIHSDPGGSHGFTQSGWASFSMFTTVVRCPQEVCPAASTPFLFSVFHVFQNSVPSVETLWKMPVVGVCPSSLQSHPQSSIAKIHEWKSKKGSRTLDLTTSTERFCRPSPLRFPIGRSVLGGSWADSKLHAQFGVNEATCIPFEASWRLRKYDIPLFYRGASFLAAADTLVRKTEKFSKIFWAGPKSLISWQVTSF